MKKLLSLILLSFVFVVPHGLQGMKTDGGGQEELPKFDDRALDYFINGQGNEIWMQILLFVDCEMFFNCALVSKEFHAVWKQFRDRHIFEASGISPTDELDGFWRYFFRKWFFLHPRAMKYHQQALKGSFPNSMEGDLSCKCKELLEKVEDFLKARLFAFVLGKEDIAVIFSAYIKEIAEKLQKCLKQDRICFREKKRDIKVLREALLRLHDIFRKFKNGEVGQKHLSNKLERYRNSNYRFFLLEVTIPDFIVGTKNRR